MLVSWLPVAVVLVVVVPAFDGTGCLGSRGRSLPTSSPLPAWDTATPITTHRRSRHQHSTQPTSVAWFDLKPIFASHAGLALDLADAEMLEAMITSSKEQLAQDNVDSARLRSLLMFISVSATCLPCCLNDTRLAPLYRLLDLITNDAFVQLPDWAEILTQLCPILTRMAHSMTRTALVTVAPSAPIAQPGLIALINDRLSTSPHVFAHSLFMEFVLDLVQVVLPSIEDRLRFVHSYGKFLVDSSTAPVAWLSPRLLFTGVTDLDKIRILLPHQLVVMSLHWTYTDHSAAFLQDLFDFVASRDLVTEVIESITQVLFAPLYSSFGLIASKCKQSLGSIALYLLGRSSTQFLNQDTTPALVQTLIHHCDMAVPEFAPIITQSLDRMNLEMIASLIRLLFSDKEDLSLFDCSLLNHLIRNRSELSERRSLWRAAVSPSNIDRLVQIYQFYLIELVALNGITSVLYYWFPPEAEPPIEAALAELALVGVLVANNRPELLRGSDLDCILGDTSIDLSSTPTALLGLLLHTADYYPELHWRLSPRVHQLIQSATSWKLSDLFGQWSPSPACNRDDLLCQVVLQDSRIDQKLNQQLRIIKTWKLHDLFDAQSIDSVSSHDANPALDRSPSTSANANSGPRTVLTDLHRERRRHLALDLIMKAIEVEPSSAACAFDNLDVDPLQSTLLGDVLNIMLDQHGFRLESSSDLSLKAICLYSALSMDATKKDRVSWLKEILLIGSMPNELMFSARDRALFILRQMSSEFLQLQCRKVKLLLDCIPDQDFIQYPSDIESIMYQILLLSIKGYWSQSFPGRLVRYVSWTSLIENPAVLDLLPHRRLIRISYVRALSRLPLQGRYSRPGRAPPR